jgi:DNA end-binding protein Ku
MEAQKMIGISWLMISRRERAVMLETRSKGIVNWTLRYRGEVRDQIFISRGSAMRRWVRT